MRCRTVGLAVAVAAAASGCSSAQGEIAARPAGDFVDSVGVNVHLTYTDTAYGDFRRVRAALLRLGVRHVRDGLVIGRPDQYARLRRLSRDGIKANLIMGDPRGRFGSGTLEQQVFTLKRRVRGAVSSVEGPNEYDASGDPDWAANLRRYQTRLAARLQRDPSLRWIPLVGPSFIDRRGFAELGDLGSAQDFGNLHSYPGGGPPEANVSEQLGLARTTAGGKRLFSTETGYHNAIRSTDEEIQPGVSERAAAVYLPRLYLEYYRRGIARTFAYELLDQRVDLSATSPDDSFGLLRENFKSKPAYRSLRNLIALLEDSGKSRFQPGSLDVSLLAGGDVRSLLLQKRDGRFYLALWRASVSVWNTEHLGSIRVRPRAVEIKLADRAKRVAAYHPARSRRPRFVRRGTDSVRVDLGADPVVLELENE